MATNEPGIDPLTKRIRRFLLEEVPPYIQAKDKKPLFSQMKEMIAIYREYGALPYHYVTHDLYKQSHSDDVLKYLPLNILGTFCATLNPSDGIDLALDKAKFSQRMHKAGLAAAEVLFVIRWNGQICDPCGTTIDFSQCVERLRAEGDEVFIKPKRGMCGFAARKVSVADIATMGWDGLRKLLYQTGGVRAQMEFVVQRVIIQHPALASIAASSVNTVRIDTYHDGESAHVNTAVLRIGNGQSCTDNLATGGFAVKVDLTSGSLVGNGKLDPAFGKDEFPTHPLTGIRFDGIALPYWAELKSLVCAAAHQMLPLRSIGWDVAITPDGPVLVEANHDYDKLLSLGGGGGYR